MKLFCKTIVLLLLIRRYYLLPQVLKILVSTMETYMMCSEPKFFPPSCEDMTQEGGYIGRRIWANPFTDTYTVCFTRVAYNFMEKNI